ncbi:MFS transporter, partial [Mycobacteroides abscessus subsp. abscessus]|nr:MFS transporter [Mycobacteroides abscessus subsp. abscessus]
MANYPTGSAPRERLRASSSSNRYLPPLGEERRERVRRRPPPEQDHPQKLTVTRVAAMRSREMGSRMYGLFQKAATADGA